MLGEIVEKVSARLKWIIYELQAIYFSYSELLVKFRLSDVHKAKIEGCRGLYKSFILKYVTLDLEKSYKNRTESSCRSFLMFNILYSQS